MLPFFVGLIMILTFYKNTSANNVIGKILTEPMNMNIFLKGDVDISNPILRLAVGADESLSQYNYCFIHELDRYYFIDNVTSLNARVVDLSCSVDVLETYKVDILNSHARFTRPIREGDYQTDSGSVEVNKTITQVYSDVELVKESTMLISVLGS